MLIRQILMAVIGLSAGILVAGGLFGFIVELGVIADFADRTHTGNKIHLYEDCAALGGIIGNVIFIYSIPIPYGKNFAYSDRAANRIFVGCWAMALAEILNVFPIFIRRLKNNKIYCWIDMCNGIGKGVGGVIYFFPDALIILIWYIL